MANRRKDDRGEEDYSFFKRFQGRFLTFFLGLILAFLTATFTIGWDTVKHKDDSKAHFINGEKKELKEFLIRAQDRTFTADEKSVVIHHLEDEDIHLNTEKLLKIDRLEVSLMKTINALDKLNTRLDKLEDQ